MILEIKNGIPLKGRVELPPSKSETIRALILTALAGGDLSRVTEGFNAPFCDDIAFAAEAAKHLSESPDAGSSAALLRMLIPVQLVLTGRAQVKCSDALIARGHAELEACFGAPLAEENGALTMTDPVIGDSFEIDCSRSSQFLSGLLIALPLMERDCRITVKNGLVSSPYAAMTLDIVRQFGGRIDETERGFVTHPSRYALPERMPVTGDMSLAAVYKAMNALGAHIDIGGAGADTRQPDKDISRHLSADECDVTDCPDIAPILAAAACAKCGDTVITGTGRLRTKESDRAKTSAELIRALGGSAETGEDRMIIHGRGALRGGECSSFGDHRIAFAAAVTAPICDEPILLRGAECVKKSAPRFWQDFAALGGVIGERY